MSKNLERLTFMESKILELGKKQYDKGYQGGIFTPGYIRKETEYGYRAINIALETLIAGNLVEKSVSHTFRKGELVELDVYKITDEGIAAVDKISAGEVEVNGKPQTKPMPFKPEVKPQAKSWNGPKPSYDARSPVDPHIERTVRSLESTVRTLAADMKALQAKLDDILARETCLPGKEPTERDIRKMSPQAMTHRVMILKAVKKVEGLHEHVLAEDIKGAYLKDCSEHGIPPKGKSQFTTFLKRLEKEGLLALKRVGCKNLGIKGQGSRVVVKATPEGMALIEQ